MDGAVAGGGVRVQGLHAVLGPVLPQRDRRRVRPGDAKRAALGALVLVHAENDALLQANLRSCMRRPGGATSLAHPESRPAFVEEEAVHRALYLARHVGVRVCRSCTPRARSASIWSPRPARRASGRPPRSARITCCSISTTTCGSGPCGCCAPADLRPRALVEGMWERVLDGTLDSLVSDHSAYTHRGEGAGLGRTSLRAPLGCQVIQETVPLVSRRGRSTAAACRWMRSPASPRRTRRARSASTRARARSCRAPTPTWRCATSRPSGWSTRAASSSRRTRGRRLTAARAGPGACARSCAGSTVHRDGEIVAAPGIGRFLSVHEDYAAAPAAAAEVHA